MRCGRCGGLLVVDSFMDFEDDEGHLWLRAWRCVNCGEVVEPAITHQRRAQRSRLVRLTKRLRQKSPKSHEIVRLSA
ncbi:MAG: hypothetical protein ACREIS_08605 [Nitrospiraceae bacterium]